MAGRGTAGISVTWQALRRADWAGASLDDWLITRWLDDVIAFIALEKVLIQRTLRVTSAGNLVNAFSSSLRVYAVIIAHVYLYWYIDRGMPAAISYLNYNSVAFASWQFFTTMAHRGKPQLLGVPSNVPLRIRWINLIVADYVSQGLKIGIGFCAVYLQFILFPAYSLTGHLMPSNVLLLVAMIILSGLLGVGFGMLFEETRVRWPLFDSILEVIMWFAFVTSGIYDCYVQLPPLVADIFSYNPMMTVIEYGRYAIDRGYPASALHLIYPISITFGLVAFGLMARRSTLRTEVP